MVCRQLHHLKKHALAMQVPEYASQNQCQPGRGALTDTRVTIFDQCIAEQYYVRNSIARSLIYNHVSLHVVICLIVI